MTHDLVITLRQKSEQLVADFDLNDDDSIDFYEFCDMISKFHSVHNKEDELIGALR